MFVVVVGGGGRGGGGGRLQSSLMFVEKGWLGKAVAGGPHEWFTCLLKYKDEDSEQLEPGVGKKV
jgi:hypothetical protein